MSRVRSHDWPRSRTPWGIRFSPICESTARPIVQWLARNVVSRSVALSITLSDADKLDALRALDQFRQWRSLDEKRYCLVCGKIIAGRQIRVAGGTRRDEPLRLSCPTAQCNSIPMDWVLPTDEILARVEVMAAEESNAAVITPVTPDGGDYVQPNREHSGIAPRLRKLAFRFKHCF